MESTRGEIEKRKRNWSLTSKRNKMKQIEKKSNREFKEIYERKEVRKQRN